MRDVGERRQAEPRRQSLHVAIGRERQDRDARPTQQVLARRVDQIGQQRPQDGGELGHVGDGPVPPALGRAADRALEDQDQGVLALTGAPSRQIAPGLDQESRDISGGEWTLMRAPRLDLDVRPAVCRLERDVLQPFGNDRSGGQLPGPGADREVCGDRFLVVKAPPGVGAVATLRPSIRPLRMHRFPDPQRTDRLTARWLFCTYRTQLVYHNTPRQSLLGLPRSWCIRSRSRENARENARMSAARHRSPADSNWLSPLSERNRPEAPTLTRLWPFLHLRPKLLPGQCIAHGPACGSRPVA